MTISTGKTKTVKLKQRRMSKVTGWVIFILSVFVVVGISTLYLAGPRLLANYDDTHRVMVTCSVSEVQGGTASSRTVKGIGSTKPQVVFETSDCGTLLLRNGVTSEDSKRIAARVVVGAPYRFEVGAGSLKMRSLISALGASPTVYKFSPVR